MIEILRNKIFNKENRRYSIIVIILILLIIGVSIVKYINYDKKIIINDIKMPVNLVKSKISVYIDGQVNSPGYIRIFKGATIEDAINKANGVTKYADIENIDLLRVLQNKEKIVIPTIRSMTMENVSINNIEENRNKININAASIDELTLLDGIGEKTAEKIIEYRLNNKFNKVEDIMQIKGVGKGKFEKIKEDICV